MIRKFNAKPGYARPCPKCGNTKEFKAISQQVAEDGCENWVECGKCGHCPTDDKPLHRVESVMGGLEPHDIVEAFLETWQELLEPQTVQP